jgi:hypothetical protein
MGSVLEITGSNNHGLFALGISLVQGTFDVDIFLPVGAPAHSRLIRSIARPMGAATVHRGWEVAAGRFLQLAAALTIPAAPIGTAHDAGTTVRWVVLGFTVICRSDQKRASGSRIAPRGILRPT